MALKRLGILAAAVFLAAPAMAQLAKDHGGVTLKEDQAKAALFGITMEGYSPTYGISWRECIDPRGETLYETPDRVLKGRLVIAPTGKACFSYNDDDYASIACYVTKKTADGFRFEDDYNAVFVTTKVVTGVKTCKPQDLVG